MLRDIRFSCIFLWTKKKLPSFTIQKPKECKRNLIINEHLKNQRMRCESNSTDIFTHKIQRHTICVIQNLTQTKINIYFSWILINVKLIMDFIKSKKKKKQMAYDIQTRWWCEWMFFFLLWCIEWWWNSLLEPNLYKVKPKMFDNAPILHHHKINHSFNQFSQHQILSQILKKKIPKNN